jgi:hypothetical protein
MRARMRRFNHLCLVTTSSPIWRLPPHLRCGWPRRKGLNDRRPESFGSLYLLIADGVSVESEVRRGTAPGRSLLSCVGPFKYAMQDPPPMADWVVLHDFTSGKRTVRGDANPGLRRYETVVAVARHSIDAVLGTRTLAERTELLRRMRDDGLLVAPVKGGRLTHKVKGGNPPSPAHDMRAYVFATQHVDYVRIAAGRLRRGR